MKTATQKRTVVFDLDGTLETPYFSNDKKKNVKAWMQRHSCGNSFDRMYAQILVGNEKYPHFFLNGAFELLRWVHDHGFEIVFFSNAVKERNEKLCPILMQRAFEGMEIPPYRILSRNNCLDTRNCHSDREQAKFQGLWFGNYKKQLAGTVVSESELPNTLMVEDDSSYAVRGEERNFVFGVYGGSANNFIAKPVLSATNGQDFHLPFYFAGILSRIVEYSDKAGKSLAEAAVQIQYADHKFDFPADGNPRKDSAGDRMDPPSPPAHEFRVFKAGLAELRKYNPELKFWGGDVRDDDWQWPDPKVPRPKPPKPKRRVRTDMTNAEAEYWMCRLQCALRVIGSTNVKSLIIKDKDGNWLVHQDESGDYVPMRVFDFHDDKYFNRKKAKTIHTLPAYESLRAVIYASSDFAKSSKRYPRLLTNEAIHARNKYEWIVFFQLWKTTKTSASNTATVKNCSMVNTKCIFTI